MPAPKKPTKPSAPQKTTKQKATPKTQGQQNAAERKERTINKNKVPKKYILIDDIRGHDLYKANVRVRDYRARKRLSEHTETAPEQAVIPGQLIMFDYFTPKTEAELEYYDAMPCTIFFGKVKTKKGEPRVLGFNIHYYPPRIRYNVMNRIFEIFRPFYEKAWNDPIKKELSHFEYGWLCEQLEKAGLGFGVRMYVPELMNMIRPIPAKAFSTAVFTEGKFRKRTREMILNYWRQWITKHT